MDAAGDQETEMSNAEDVAEKGVDDDPEAAAGGAHHDEDLPGGEDEGQAQRALGAPRTPRAKEVEAHELTHCPPRSWCDHCVKGQSKDRPHTSITGEYADSSIVRVSMD